MEQNDRFDAEVTFLKGKRTEGKQRFCLSFPCIAQSKTEALNVADKYKLPKGHHVTGVSLIERSKCEYLITLKGWRDNIVRARAR